MVSVNLPLCYLLCSREAACFLVIREKSPGYYLKEQGKASTDFLECGICHVDALLCCGFSFSSYLFVISLVFLLRTGRGLWR